MKGVGRTEKDWNSGTLQRDNKKVINMVCQSIEQIVHFYRLFE